MEDGDEILFQGIEGMKLKDGQKHVDPEVKSNSINDTIHKVKVISPFSFKIGDTTIFEKYESKGTAKQLKTKIQMKFANFEQAVVKSATDIQLDGNLAVADFEKMQHS